MKKQFFKTNAIKVYSIAVISSMLIFANFTTANASGKVESGNSAAITYSGVRNNLMTFNVNYSNPTAEVFTVELTDDQGTLLYQKKFNDKNFDKNILLKNEGEKVMVNFIVRAGKNSTNQKFEIEPLTRVVEEMVVTKL